MSDPLASSSPTDTIVAIATPSGKGGVGIVRVSGAAARRIARAITQRDDLPPRVATVSRFVDAQRALIDTGIALVFVAPHSYTGEDTLELHAHGSPVVLQLLVEACIAAGGGRTRHARAGEFTQRAFLNGKLDLAQAESVADIIDAGSRAAARAAVNSLSGTFSSQINRLREQLIRLRMFTEATLDFPEEDVDFLQAENARGQAQAVARSLDEVLKSAQQGQLLHDGIRIVLVGAPNVGKSSLMNRLAGDEIAIVTPIAGTTRDTLRSRITLNGLPAEIIDTAGLRDDVIDEVERIGIARTWSAVERADVVLILIDATRPHETQLDTAMQAKLPQDVPTIVVRNKIDLLAASDLSKSGLVPAAQIGHFAREKISEMAVSALTGEGVDTLIAHIGNIVGYTGAHEGTFTARARHVDALRRAHTHLDAALVQLDIPALELFAEELRLAHDALGEIVGAFTADDLLGEIFGKFCIGK